jgi:hypothetical protein
MSVESVRGTPRRVTAVAPRTVLKRYTIQLREVAPLDCARWMGEAHRGGGSSLGGDFGTRRLAS